MISRNRKGEEKRERADGQIAFQIEGAKAVITDDNINRIANGLESFRVSVIYLDGTFISEIKKKERDCYSNENSEQKKISIEMCSYPEEFLG